MTRRNRQKRQADRLAESIDRPLTEDGNTKLGDIIPSNFDLEKTVLDKSGISSDEKVEKYLKSLTKRQRQVAELIIQGANPGEIKEKLGLTNKQYETAV